MADLKNPNSTRPFRVLPGGGDTAKIAKTPDSSSSTVSKSQTGTSPVTTSGTGPTAGMVARRREMERRRRDEQREQNRLADEAAEGWRRIFRTVALVVCLGGAAYAYWRIQNVYGNAWPMMAVWILMGTFLFGGLGAMIWYINKPDL